MNEFLSSLGSVAWWLGVVFVGIVLNILSAYLKPTLDGSLSKVSTWWRNRTEVARASRVETVARLKADKHKQLLMLAEESRHRLRAIKYFLFSLLFLLMYVSLKVSYSIAITTELEPPSSWFGRVAFWGSLLVQFFGILEHMAAIKCRFLVDDAQVEHEMERSN